MDGPRDIFTYGGVFVDANVVENPQKELSAVYYDRLAEDTAQMSRTTIKARCSFIPTAAAAPVTLDPSTVTSRSHWGTGSPQKPVVTKTATGAYTITYPATFTDALGLVEDVTFDDASAQVRGATDGHARVRGITGTAITVFVYDAASALADLTGNTVHVRAE